MKNPLEENTHVYDPEANAHWVQIRQHVKKYGGVPKTLYDAARLQRGPVATHNLQFEHGDAGVEASSQ